ncbi:MAG: inositol monophosphatase [Opitutae bacterium]|nr:inositol monophosphatase [Opitutae bacterium]
MTAQQLTAALSAAVAAARAAGAVMRRDLRAVKRVNQQTAHDIKLELDVRCQQLIERRLHRAFPAIAVLGEEGSSGAAEAATRWVIDPIDGTVNFAYGIPHACVCIALQVRSRARAARVDGGYATVLGVIYDPFLNELWTAVSGQKARLNGRPLRVSRRARLAESMLAMGYGKNEAMAAAAMPTLAALSARARKVRNMGSAGLALAYVATGRFDAYVERGINLWDIAAGGFIIERAGGKFWRERLPDGEGYRMIASNGRLHRPLQALRVVD